jgi:tRNA nucleotidyltransferase (CCA-adding enzyme)
LHAKSFEDDATRILRILRFQGRFGYKIEGQSLKWMQAAMPFLKDISGARIRNELDSILLEDERNAILREMSELGVLEAIHPKLIYSAAIGESLDKLELGQIDPEWELENIGIEKIGLLVLLMQQKSEDIEAISKRFSLEKEISVAILDADRGRKSEGDWAKMKASQASLILETLSPLARYALYVSSNVEEKKVFEKYALEWRLVRSKSDGNTLREAGLTEGPRYAEILRTLRAAWLDGQISTEKEEKKLLQKMLDESDG